MQIPENILEVIEKYLSGVATVAEKNRLHEWFHALDHEDIVVDSPDLHAAENIEARLRQRITQSLENMKAGVRRDAPERPVYRVHTASARAYWRNAAAAVVLILFAAGSYLYYGKIRRGRSAKQQPVAALLKADILPGGNKATLTLANGARLVLDSMHDGALLQQGAAKILKSADGQLSYNTGSFLPAPDAAVTYNTMTTPRGGQYKIVLSDGSKIWLNAASSVRYPTSFGDSARTVEISGEAYFEIAPLRSKKDNTRVPFTVKIDGISGEGSEVQVLGTHFNISAYDDDELTRVTLLEGSVKMRKGSAAAILKPGEFAMIRANKNGIEQADDPEAESAIAWKDGRFEFNSKSSIREIMRRIARWYDVDIVYEQDVGDKAFGGAIPRQSSVTDVLKMLALTGSVHFKIDGRTVTVMK